MKKLLLRDVKMKRERMYNDREHQRAIYEEVKMRKPKITCFQYKNYYDIRVYHASFSADALMSLVDLLPEEKVIVLIASDMDIGTIVSSLGKSIQIYRGTTYDDTMMFVCNKRDLLSLLHQVDIAELDDLFVASVKNDVISDELMHSLEHSASAIVRIGISEMSVAVVFSENEMIISSSKTKYAVKSMKDEIRNIFGA